MPIWVLGQLYGYQGLSRMKRNHIHFAPDVPGGQEIISGKQFVVYVHKFCFLLTYFCTTTRNETQLSSFNIY